MQEETLRTKPKTAATVEELERLLPLLEIAQEEETKAAVSKAVEKALADERAQAAAKVYFILKRIPYDCAYVLQHCPPLSVFQA